MAGSVGLGNGTLLSHGRRRRNTAVRAVMKDDKEKADIEASKASRFLEKLALKKVLSLLDIYV